MVRPTQPLMSRIRLRMTTKGVSGGYYKGNRTGSMGYFEKNGSYVIDWKKVRTYVVPEGLEHFKLTPFVTKLMPPTKTRYTQEIERKNRTLTVERALGPKDFLDMWASDNGEEVIKQEAIHDRNRARRAESRAIEKAEAKARAEAEEVQAKAKAKAQAQARARAQK